jgi:hypothetical protein
MKPLLIGVLMVGGGLVVSLLSGKFWHWVYWS